MANILVVEDDQLIASQLQKFLQHAKHQVTLLDSGELVVETAKSNAPDLIVLDIMLPVKDGVTCCQEIRQFSDVPIVMLTAKVEEIDRIIGLNAGADDYVCKPFSGQEIVLRIQAILRRVGIKSESTALTLNNDTFHVQYQQTHCELSAMEFRLFKLLFDNPARIYSRAQILDLAYPDMRDVSDRTIDSHIRNIRKKLKQMPLEQEIIGSVYGAGYRYLPVESEHA